MNSAIRNRTLLIAGLLALALPTLLLGAGDPVPASMVKPPRKQPRAEAERKSAGCTSCHTATDQKTMHASESVVLGCSDCHGGDPAVKAQGAPGSAPYLEAQRRAHVLPKDGKLWGGSANPERSYTALLTRETWRSSTSSTRATCVAAEYACGSCHEDEVRYVQKSMMTHSAMLYGAALYNNGVLPMKDGIVGESYGPDGQPRQINTVPPPTPEETRDKGVLPFVVPFPRWELSQTANPFRVFERGGRRRLEIGLPDLFEEPGKPDKGLTPRGFGTLLRTDPAFWASRTPAYSIRCSPCSAPTTIPAITAPPAALPVTSSTPTTATPVHSGPYAATATGGTHPQPGSHHSQERIRPSHPAPFTRSIPVQPVHRLPHAPGHGRLEHVPRLHLVGQRDRRRAPCIPKEQKLTSEAEATALARNPEAASLRGNWCDREFLRNVSDLNPKLKHTQFADFHGHGWVFRAVFKHDRKGALLDKDDKPSIADEDPNKFQKRRAPQGHPPREGHALRGLPLQAGCARQRQTLRRSPRRRRDRMRRLPRHIHALTRRADAAARQRLLRRTELAPARPPSAPGASNGAARPLIQRSMVDAEKLEWIVSAQVMDSRTIPAATTTTKKPAARKTIQKDNKT